MSRGERESLQAIMDCMAELQVLAESLSGYVLELDPDGSRFPAMRRITEMLVQMAWGWEAGGGLMERVQELTP